jgi:GNAT superfamily N-acetyltransferase
MKIRTYTPRDEAGAIALWNASLPPDALDRGNFYRRVLLDVNFNPALYLLAEEAGQLLGFAYGTTRRAPDEAAGLQPGQGWVVALGVAPGSRGQGVGRALLAALEAALAAAGVKTVDVGPYATNYFCPGVDTEAYGDGVRFLKAKGYGEKGACASMDMALRGYAPPARSLEKKRALQGEGYAVGFFQYQDALPLLAFLREHFPWWLPDVRGSLLAGRAESTLLLARDAAGAVAGFALRAMDGCEGRFGPFGVRPALQGIGLGGVLFHEMMADMAAKRIFYTWLVWTGGRNLDIYRAWGMKVYRSYVMFGKELPPGANKN